MVACLPLVQRVQGSIPGKVVNFHLKIFDFGARRGGDVHFLIARLCITGLDYIPNLSAVYMLRRHIVLLIAIHPSDGDLSLSVPLVLFEKSKLSAGTKFHLLPSFHNHLTHHNTITLHKAFHLQSS